MLGRARPVLGDGAGLEDLGDLRVRLDAGERHERRRGGDIAGLEGVHEGERDRLLLGPRPRELLGVRVPGGGQGHEKGDERADEGALGMTLQGWHSPLRSC